MYVCMYIISFIHYGSPFLPQKYKLTRQPEAKLIENVSLLVFNAPDQHTRLSTRFNKSGRTCRSWLWDQVIAFQCGSDFFQKDFLTLHSLKEVKRPFF